MGSLKEQYQETAKRALQTVLITGMQAEKDKDMRTKRCFDVNYKDGQKQCIRWILAAPAHPEFMHALNVLKQTRTLEALQIKVEEDRATMSKAAKDVWDALKAGGSGGGSSSGPAERSEQGDEHIKSSAVHQDKMRGGIPWFEFSEENLAMARCGALRGVARLGQVVASWESLIIFTVPFVRVGHANRVRWVVLSYECGWLLLHVIRALFSSHQCCTLVRFLKLRCCAPAQEFHAQF